MKSFEDICRMTQPEVKKYMKQYLISNKYAVIDQDGFLYAKGTVPVLLVAHMDTVHHQQCKSIIHLDNKISSPQGIGGDDRCGVFMIMNIIKELHCSVLLCEDEEKGCIGAHKFVKAQYSIDGADGKKTQLKYVEDLDVNYMIEFDRKGSNDAVFYHCGNEDFIDFVEDVTNFKFANGSVSDISVLMQPANRSAVNLSCGYYNAHTPMEYVMYDEMMDTIEAAKALIKTECDKPFEYVRKTYVPSAQPTYKFPSYANHQFNRLHDEGEYCGNLFEDPDEYNDEPLAHAALNDTEVELEVTIYDECLSEAIIIATGETKAECWMALFLENPSLCFNDIADYTFS